MSCILWVVTKWWWGKRGGTKRWKLGLAVSAQVTRSLSLEIPLKKILSGIYKKAWLVLKVLSFDVALLNMRLLPGRWVHWHFRLGGKQARMQVKAGQAGGCSRAWLMLVTAGKTDFCPCRQLQASIHSPWCLIGKMKTIYIITGLLEVP